MNIFTSLFLILKKGRRNSPPETKPVPTPAVEVVVTVEAGSEASRLCGSSEEENETVFLSIFRILLHTASTSATHRLFLGSIYSTSVGSGFQALVFLHRRFFWSSPSSSADINTSDPPPTDHHRSLAASPPSPPRTTVVVDRMLMLCSQPSDLHNVGNQTTVGKPGQGF
ncbi:unnamed protein product [Lactuca virosa]|uniref:Uncharacterized protein n=1 Tax=Lactuca virosa TaxID=75947 RepID=A0AAU9MNT8_9ASTR|nr:unnamed protein product [Lactuca virosa]